MIEVASTNHALLWWLSDRAWAITGDRHGFGRTHQTGVTNGAAKYAEGHSKEELVRINCQACDSNRYGLLNQPYIATSFAGIDPEVYVTCLKCGNKQIDAENWYDV